MNTSLGLRLLFCTSRRKLTLVESWRMPNLTVSMGMLSTVILYMCPRPPIPRCGDERKFIDRFWKSNPLYLSMLAIGLSLPLSTLRLSVGSSSRNCSSSITFSLRCCSTFAISLSTCFISSSYPPRAFRSSCRLPLLAFAHVVSGDVCMSSSRSLGRYVFFSVRMVRSLMIACRLWL